ncbi:hypothetical protein HPB51_025139 [Rhipicephalus microplus]|uniref:Uncharacterized protein n=1 Tax=Rhipicephalus microplus TaxID=6941 RepID=A0A9J6DRL9_RHIMP|nr:hypothetical protein HPB51_025139 [Rhipicephalus microplus]
MILQALRGFTSFSSSAARRRSSFFRARLLSWPGSLTTVRIGFRREEAKTVEVRKTDGDAAELPTRADAFRRLREDRLKASARATIAPPAFPHSLRPGSTQRRPALWPHRLRTDLPDALDEAVGSPPSTLLPDTIDDLD